MKNFEDVVQSIIKDQENVMGPLALEQANTVQGLQVDSKGNVKVSLTKPTDAPDVLIKLVKKYEQFFGQASIEVCKDSIKKAGVSSDDKDLPEILR